MVSSWTHWTPVWLGEQVTRRILMLLTKLAFLWAALAGSVRRASLEVPNQPHAHWVSKN